MTTINHHKNAMLQYIEREWNALMHVVEQLSPQQINTPDAGGWSPKDNLAHLEEWMRIMIGFHLDGRPENEVSGLPAEVTVNRDFNAMNAAFFERHKNESPEAVLASIKATYTQAVARLTAMPFEELLKPRWPDDPEARPVLLWILGNTAEHFKEHRDTLEKILK